MSYVNDIENKVRDYLSGDYEVTEVRTIPSVENVPFGKKAMKMKLCVFCIDLRKSTELMFLHQQQTSGKIHKAFLTTVTKVVLENGGVIRSFQGDSLLAFWSGADKNEISKAVKAAMIVKWFLNVKLKNYFEKYSELDYGIGIDMGDVYILRAGISRDSNNNDLVFIGTCVNFAVAIANQAKSPTNIEISESVYSNLIDDWIYTNKNNQKLNMWIDGIIDWKGTKYKTKVTNYHSYLE